MKKKGNGVHQFKITLQDVKPAVWRRIQTPSGYSFWDLHVAIQDAMGWKDRHLHEFQILDPNQRKLESIGIPDDDDFGPAEVVPGWERSVARYFSGENPVATYVYDFGDDCMAFTSLSSATVSLKDHSHRAPGSSNATSFTSKQRGSNEPPTHSSSSPPRGLPGFLMARRNSA